MKYCEIVKYVCSWKGLWRVKIDWNKWIKKKKNEDINSCAYALIHLQISLFGLQNSLVWSVNCAKTMKVTCNVERDALRTTHDIVWSLAHQMSNLATLLRLCQKVASQQLKKNDCCTEW